MAGKHERESFLEKAAGVFDLPADTLAGLSRVEIIGTKELYVENHKGILSLDENEIKLNAGRMIMRIDGQRLSVISMNASELRIGGSIECVQFISV